MGYRVRRIGAEEWRQLRRLRLAALRTEPGAYFEQYADAVQVPAEGWQERAAASAGSAERALFVAEGDDGRWIGMAGAPASPGPAASSRTAPTPATSSSRCPAPWAE